MTFLAFDYRSLLVYIPTIIFCLIVFLAMFRGYRHGFRKSFILFINMIIAMGISFGIFYIIFGSNFDENVVKIANYGLGQFNLNLTKILKTSQDYNTLSEYMIEYLAVNLPSNFLNSSSLTTMVGVLMAMAESVVRLAVLLVLVVIYWLIKFVLYIIYLIFFKEGRRKKKIIKNAFDKKHGLQIYKRKKAPLLGATVGAFRGLVIALLLFSFIGSFFFVLSGGHYSENKEDVVIDVNDNEYDITEYYDIVNRYGTVGIGKILESVGTNNGPLYLLLSDYLLKGNYVGEFEEGIDPSSFYGRKELAPVVGLIKDLAIEAFRYNIDINFNNPDNLISALNKEKDGVMFIDKVNEIISSYNFGNYTLFLSQCLVKAMAENALENGSQDFNNKLLVTLFAGDNRIKPNEIVSNNNVHAIFKFITVLAKNYKVLETINIDNSISQTKALGIHTYDGANGMFSDEQAESLKTIINEIDEMLGSFDFMKNGKSSKLITDITILCFEEFVPDYSLDGVSKINDQFSMYNINWTNSISSMFDILIDIVNFVNQNNVLDSTELIDILLTDLNNSESVSTKLLFKIVDNEIVGALLNAQGLKDMIEETLFGIEIPSSLALGSYYYNGSIQKGELSILLHNLSTKAHSLYTIFNDETITNTEKLSQIFDANLGISKVITNSLDDSNEKYSKLLHFCISSLMLNMDNLDVDIPFYVPSSVMYYDNAINVTMIKSSELVVMTDLIGDIAPNIFSEEIDYASLLTAKNIENLMKSSILKATIAITTYNQIANNKNFLNAIPTSYCLTDDNLDTSLDKWVGTDNDKGELRRIVDALIEADILNKLLSNLPANEVVKLFLEMKSTTIEKAMDSVILNVIITDQISRVNLDDKNHIIIPSKAIKQQVDGKNLLKSSEIVNAFNLINETALKEIITGDTVADSSLMIDTLLNLSEDAKLNFINSSILNATTTAYITNLEINAGTSKINFIIPNVAKTDLNEDEANGYVGLLSFEAFSNMLGSLKIILGDSSDITNLPFNRLLEDDVIDSVTKSSILTANIINILNHTFTEEANSSITDYISYPKAYMVSKEQLEENFESTRWIKQNEFNKLLRSIDLLGASFDSNNNFILDQTKFTKIALNAGDENSNFRQLINSEIIYASISKAITNQLEVLPVVTTNLYEDDQTLEKHLVITEDELISLLNGIELLIGQDKLNQGISFDEIGNFITVDEIEKNGLLEVDNLDKLLNSVIIETNISNIVKDYIADSSEIILLEKYNYSSYEDEAIYEWLSVNSDGSLKENGGQTKRLIHSLDSLGLVDLITSSSNKDFTISMFSDLTDEEIDIVLSSDIIYVTIINLFINNTSFKETMSVPARFMVSDDLKKVDSILNLEIVKADEVRKVIKAVREIGVDISPENNSFNLNSILGLNEKSSYYDKTKLEVVHESLIIWLTLSDFILNLDNSNNQNNSKNMFSLPDLKYITDSNLTINNEIYITLEEVTNLIDAVNEIGLKEIDNLDVSIFLENNINFQTVCASYIVWFTLSKGLLAISTIDIPQVVLVNGYMIPDYKEKFISINEIDILINSLKESFKVSDFESLDFASVAQSVSDENVWNSLILRYTLSNYLIDSSTLPLILSDFDTFESDSNGILSNELILKKDTITCLINSLNILGVKSGFENPSFNDFQYILENFDTILESTIIQNLISQNIFEGKQKVLANTTQKLLTINKEEIYQIEKDEIKAFFTVATIFGNSFDVDQSVKFDNDKLSKIIDSNILRVTYSDSILEQYSNELTLITTVFNITITEKVNVISKDNSYQEMEIEVITTEALKELVKYLGTK